MHDEAAAAERLASRNAPRRPSAMDAFAGARQLIMREDWAAGLKAFDEAATGGASPTALDRLLAEIAQIRLAEFDFTVAPLPASLIRDAGGEIPVRRLLLAPLIRSERPQDAAVVLEKLLEAYPNLVDARRHMISILAKQERWDEAIQQVDLAAASAPADLALQVMRIQYRLLIKQVPEAAAIALELKPRITPAFRDAHLVLIALLRGGHANEAAEIAANYDPGKFPSPEVAAAATQALLMSGRADRAITVGERAIKVGQDSAQLRGHVGEAIILAGRPQDISSRAIHHLEVGLVLSPDDKRLNTLFGEALLKSNRPEEAVSFLEKATAIELKSPKTRSLYARALRASGRYDDAANQYLQVLDRKPDAWASHRQAVGVLSQAGRSEEASKVFNAMIAKRAATLPDTFAEALANLDKKVDEAQVPQARLDWAWSLRQGQDDIDRAEWERRAKWGMLADLLIIDWLECREDQAEEAMSLMASLQRADEAFAPLAGKGFIIATAHLGPLFSGPILLELCGQPSRWVASTPSIADAHYAASVISTSDQTEVQVAKACLKSLQTGYAVGIAIDGSGRMGSPTIPFEGQDITYSSFAARAAHRAGVPSLFYAARWEGDRIAYTFETLPSPEPGEAVIPFEARWREAYLANLRIQLGGPPENLRLAGGLWSTIRPMS